MGVEALHFGFHTAIGVKETELATLLRPVDGRDDWDLITPGKRFYLDLGKFAVTSSGPLGLDQYQKNG
jgi:hypothetical protein